MFGTGGGGGGVPLIEDVFSAGVGGRGQLGGEDR